MLWHVQKKKIEIQNQSCRSLISPSNHSYSARMKRPTHLSTSTPALTHEWSFKLPRLVQECKRGSAAKFSQRWHANLTAVCTENSCGGVLWSCLVFSYTWDGQWELRSSRWSRVLSVECVSVEWPLKDLSCWILSKSSLPLPVSPVLPTPALTLIVFFFLSNWKSQSL